MKKPNLLYIQLNPMYTVKHQSYSVKNRTIYTIACLTQLGSHQDTSVWNMLYGCISSTLEEKPILTGIKLLPADKTKTQPISPHPFSESCSHMTKSHDFSVTWQKSYGKTVSINTWMIFSGGSRNFTLYTLSPEGSTARLYIIVASYDTLGYRGATVF